MAFLKDRFPEAANYGDVVRAYPEIMFHMLDVEQALLRGPSPLSEAQREMIVSYVSSLNACTYCYKSHLYVADELGIDQATTNAAIADLDSAGVEASFKQVLAFVRKLTETPSRMTQADTDRLISAGWDEKAVFHATAIAGYTNLVNRIADGVGLDTADGPLQEIAKHLAVGGYNGFKAVINAEREAAGLPVL